MFHMNPRSLLYYYHVVLCLLTFMAPFQGASAEDLLAIWDFSEPALRAPELDPNGLRINILYNVSDYIIPTMVYYNVTNWECEDSVEQWFVPSLVSPGLDIVQGDGTGDGVIEVEINVDPFSFDDVGAGNIASFWQQDNQDRYQIKFCLFVGVQTEDAGDPVMVDSSQTQIMVTYDLTDGFVLDLEVAPVGNEANATDGYGVDG